MATHSRILAKRIPWMEEPVRLQSIGRKESDMTETTEHTPHLMTFLCLLRTFETYSFSNFPLCNTVLLTTVTVLCLRSPEFIHLITGNSYL